MNLSPDPTRRFTGRAADYVRARPGYPGLVELLEREIGLGPEWVVADVGSGTGISAQPFLERGCTVIGVEPNAEMRASAERQLGGYPAFRSVDGTAERTGLEAGSVDSVVVAQAFHWLDPGPARREFARVLREPRWVVVAWNNRHTAGTPFLAAYESLLREFGTDYAKVGHRTVVSGSGSAPERPEVRSFFRGRCERRVLPNSQELDLDGLRSRLLSASYVPAAGDPRFEAMLRALERLHREHARESRVQLTYDLEVWFGRLS